jgi:hypothetical protein
MKRTIIYWKTSDMERKREVKAELGITSVSVNGESDYNGDPERLVPYVEEGLIVIRTKDEQERRIKEVRFHTKQSKSNNSKETGCGGRKRKVREQIRTSSISDLGLFEVCRSGQ